MWHFRRPLFRGLSLRLSGYPACGGGLVRRTVQHDEVSNLPRKGRLLASVSLSLVGVLNRLRGPLRSPCRRSHETTTGSSAVFRVSPSKRRCAPRRTMIPTGFRDDSLRGRCFSSVFVCLLDTTDLSAAIVCYFAARRIAAQPHARRYRFDVAVYAKGVTAKHPEPSLPYAGVAVNCLALPWRLARCCTHGRARVSVARRRNFPGRIRPSTHSAPTERAHCQVQRSRSGGVSAGRSEDPRRPFR